MTSWTHLDMIFLAAQLHLRDSTLPRSLLSWSRGPPTLRNECVALQPNLDSPTPPDHLYVWHTTCPSITTSVCHATSLSVCHPASPISLSNDPSPPHHVHLSYGHVLLLHNMSICLSINRYVSRTVCLYHCQSIHHLHPSFIHPVHPPSRHLVHDRLQSIHQTIHHPPTTCTPSYHIRPAVLPCLTIPPPSTAVRQTVCHCPTVYRPPHPSNHLTPSQCLYDATINPSACPSPSDCLSTTMPRLPMCPSSHTIHRTQDSSQSLAVMNGEQSRKAKKFHRVFPNYDLLLRALDASLYMFSST